MTDFDKVVHSYVEQFIVALYDFDVNDEYGKSYMELYKWEVKNIFDDFILWVKWLKDYDEFPGTKDIYQRLLYLEWEHIGKFDIHKAKQDGRNYNKIRSHCYNIIFTLQNLIISELLKVSDDGTTDNNTGEI